MLRLRQDDAQYARYTRHLEIPLEPGSTRPIDPHVHGSFGLEPGSYSLACQVFVGALDRILQIEDDGIRTGLPGLLETLWPVSRYKEIAGADYVLLLKVSMIALCSWLHYGVVFWQEGWNLGWLPALGDHDNALERDYDLAILVVAGGMHRHDADIRARL